MRTLITRTAIDAVECAYASTTLATGRWVHEVAVALRPLLDHGHGILGWCYDARDVTSPSLDGVAAIDVDQRFLQALGAVNSDPLNSYSMKRSHYLTPAGPITQSVGPDVERFLPIWTRNTEPLGIGDLLVLNAMNYGFRGCAFSCPTPQRLERNALRDALLSRVVAHLVTAYRLRHSSASGACPDESVEAFVTPEGKISHASGLARAAGSRQALSRAVQASELARGRMRRADPEEALRIWETMVDGRWTLIDHFDSDGRRFLVAKINEPVHDVPLLSRREAQVTAMASVGHANKMIAYELGLKEGTVATLLRRAKSKLRASSFDELLAKAEPRRSFSEPQQK